MSRLLDIAHAYWNAGLTPGPHVAGGTIVPISHWDLRAEAVPPGMGLPAREGES
jgi:hypothetical protein